MKIYWEKIPKCFTHIAMDEDKIVVAYLTEPKYCSETWEIIKGFKRRLIEDEEYELDGTEDWKESLQERPKECKVCHGHGQEGVISVDASGLYMRKCDFCNGTGVES